jgi:hypothetical protein
MIHLLVKISIITKDMINRYKRIEPLKKKLRRWIFHEKNYVPPTIQE